MFEIKPQENQNLGVNILKLTRKFLFRKVREVCRKNFHLVAPPKTAVVPSYDQKAKKVNEY